MLLRSLVQSPLPPLREVVDRVTQPFGSEIIGVDIKDRYLGSLFTFETTLAVAGDKHPVVGVAPHISPHSAVLCQKGYVAQCVVVAFARSTYDSNVAKTSLKEELHCFCLVVSLLVGRVVDDVGETSAVLLAERVTVANYCIGRIALSYVVVCSAIAAYDVSALQSICKGSSADG